MADQPVLLDSPRLGAITVTIGEHEYVLRPVVMEELERFTLALADLGDGEDTSAMTQRERLERGFADRRLLLDWWRDVISTLAPAGAPPLPDAGLPAWLSSGDLAGAVITCWQGSPLAPGAR